MHEPYELCQQYHHQKSDCMLLAILSFVFWCFMQICMILQRKLLCCSRSPPCFFLSMLLIFSLLVLVSKLSTPFHIRSGIFLLLLFWSINLIISRVIILVQTCCFLVLSFIITVVLLVLNVNLLHFAGQTHNIFLLVIVVFARY